MTKGKRIFFIIYFSILFIFLLSLITLSILGNKNRIGYLTDFQLDIDKTDRLNTLYDAKTNYVYKFKIRYYDKIFRNNDIYGVYPNLSNLPEFIKEARMDKAGSPFGELIASQNISLDKIDNIDYKLKLRKNIIYILLFVLFFIILFYFIFYERNIQIAFNIVYYTLLSILIIVISIFIYNNIVQAAWSYYSLGDEMPLINGILKGIPIKLHISTNHRFFPLWTLHTNICLLFGRTPLIYTSYISLLFLISIVLLFLIMKNYSNKLISVLLIFFILFGAKDMPYLYMYIIFMETPVILLTILFIIFYERALIKNNTLCYVLAFISCFLATYHKEIIFSIFLIFSLMQIIFNKKVNKKNTFFLYSLIINSIVFILLYAIVSNVYASSQNYVDQLGRNHSIFQVFILYIKNNYLLLIFLILAFIRIYYLLIKKDRTLLKYDAYLFSGIALVFGYSILKLYNLYYSTVSIVLCVIAFSGYIGNLLKINKNEKNYKQLFIYGTLFILIFFNILMTYKYNIDLYYSILSGRKSTKHQTKLLLNLNDKGFTLYNFNNTWIHKVVDSSLRYYKDTNNYYDSQILNQVDINNINAIDNKSVILAYQYQTDLNEFIYSINSNNENKYIRVDFPYIFYSNIYINEKYYKELIEEVIKEFGYFAIL